MSSSAISATAAAMLRASSVLHRRPLLPVLTATTLNNPRRWLSRLPDSDVGTTSNGIPTPTTIVPLMCEINGHPDNRLRMARERLQATTALASPTVTANVSDRLKKARAEARQRSLSSVPPEESPRINSNAKYRGDKYRGDKYRGNKYRGVVKECGLDVTTYENSPVRTDGYSSGAITADRLTKARRKALARLAEPPKAGTRSEEESTGFERTKHEKETKTVKENGLNFRWIPQKERKSDGTSSGATAADRLRLAREAALKQLSNPLPTGT